jgi:serine/threonine protein kinase
MLHRLNHPNIVRVDRLFEHDERPIIVMEYVKGTSFEDLVRETGKAIPTHVSMIAVMQAADALEAAYNEPLGPNNQPMRIVHRDLKPSNLLISVEGSIKLVDFGVARAEFVGREVHTVAVPRGSMGYSSPEQRMGIPTNSPALDVFSLGMTLVYLLTGKIMVLPMNPDRYVEALERQVAYVKPDDVDEETQQALQKVICEMCSFDEVSRPAMKDIVLQCTKILAGVDIEQCLGEYGSGCVQPFVARHVVSHPYEHPSYSEVSFLEGLHSDVPDVISLSPARIGPELVEAFLAVEGWEERFEELESFVQNMDNWPREPFLSLLKRAQRPWWRMFGTSVPAAQVIAALRILSYAPSEESALFAMKLKKHSNPLIVTAAREHLARGDEYRR